MAEAMVAGAFLSAVFETLFRRLTSPEFVNFIRGKKSIDDDQLKELNVKLRRASVLLNDAEERQLQEPAVREWLDDLKDVIYRAQDLVDELEDEARSKKQEYCKSETSFRKKMKNKIISSISKSDKTVKGEIAKMLKDLNLLLENEVGRGLKVEDAHKSSTTTGTSSKRQPAPWPQERQVHGRNGDKEEIMKLLLSSDVWGSNIGVLPIVGMGGLGKTTLAQLVYNDSRLKEHDFSFKAWVTVSTDFDIFRIIKIILKQVSPGSRHDNEEPTACQLALNEALKDQKFLIVLDDVWDEDYDNWNVLRSTFGFGEHESRVIVTTRSNTVASNVKTGPIYELHQVSDDYCWQIFVDHAFNGDLNADRRLQEIGSRLVEKCRGIPLALTSLGGLLRSEKSPKKWESVLNNHVWKTNKILPSLWLSYHYLPSCLKQCFAYCSVFPKDFEFGKNEIILLWMAEGFLQSDEKEKQMEEIGEEYFNNLISRSLFQRSGTSYKETYVMHDLFHDLAMFVSREFCFALDDNKKFKLLTSKIRHLSYTIVSNIDIDQESLRRFLSAKGKNLRTFIGLEQSYGLEQSSNGELVEELLAAGRCLRVLSTRVSTLPHSIGNLNHLRYLNLSNSGFQEIPCSVCTLYNLQILLLSNCPKLTRLPNNLRRLINLLHLNTSRTILVEMPPQMGNLKHLRTLNEFVLSENDHSSSIKELGELQQLGGQLCISGLQNVNNVEDVLKADLKSKKNLSKLILKWNGDTRSEQHEKVLDALQPHRNLERLDIYEYPGSNFPNWVGDSQFLNIVSMSLIDNKYCCSLPPLGQLPFLQDLLIERFQMVEVIGAEFYGNISYVSIPFRSLKSLTIEHMPKLNKWLFIGNEKKGGCFPCLKSLRVLACPNATGSLPDNHKVEHLYIRESYKSIESFSLNHYPSLEVLTLYNCNSTKSLPLDYFPRLKRLALWQCENLESLTFPEELDTTVVLRSLNTLELLDCFNLRSLPQHMNMLLPSLAVLEICRCPEIESFLEGGLPSKLEKLVIWGCNKLVAQHVHQDLEGLTSLKTLEFRPSAVVSDSYKQLQRQPTILERRYQKEKGENRDKISRIANLHIGVETRASTTIAQGLGDK